ncbi:aldehyde dehydrogenase family protein [Sphingosinicella microcystinivorans]|uniref:aldehyde dehydrogenase family protein n=1 Tax=Sphingosinicella microcystinivorans TaxID=335406 RepID=UPI0022F39C67|nr:aldehyde dehydrogenase family protein [Sphingosinicella microcystinivorans]WBX84173.1 aldehyde dehydrogenase family protein [Sphingosinicella microcystinivorans]
MDDFMTHAERLIALIDAHQEADLPRCEVIDPATGAAFASFGVATPRHVNAAVDAARQAARDNAVCPLTHRRAFLSAIADAIEGAAEGLAELLTLEQGKPLAEAADEVAWSAELFRYYAAMLPDRAESLFDETTPTHRRLYKPLGVVAGIVPWNFPFLIAAMKVAPAILTGNAVVMKPSPTTPLTALALDALTASVLPKGLLQVLGDDGSIGPLLTAHPGIAKIAFTGSTDTGRAVMESAAAHLSRVTLELGGNDAAIILDDVDVAQAALGIFRGAFSNAGQICGAVKRVYVQDTIFDAFATELGRLVEAMTVGNGLIKGVSTGPVQNERQYLRAMALRERAMADGRLVAQATVPEGTGYFVPPTVFADLADDHPLVAEEQFAPLLPLQRFTSDEDAIARANASVFALTASTWSSDPVRAERVAERLEAALLCINAHNSVPPGVGLEMAKQSGVGWLLGIEGLKQYLQSYVLIPTA